MNVPRRRAFEPDRGGSAGNPFPQARTAGLALLPPAAVALVMLLPGLTAGPTLDAAVFTHIGLALRAGELPYRDVWDHKPPGVYLLLAFAQSALPTLDAWLVTWLTTAAFTVGTLAALYGVLEHNRPGDRHAITMLAAAIALTCYPVALGGGYTEEFAVLPGIVAILVVSRRSDRRGAFGAGVLIGLANLLSFEAIPVGVAVAVVLFLGNTGRARILTMLAFVIGGAAVAVPVLAWIVAAGLLPMATDAIVTYNAAYRTVNQANLGQFLATSEQVVLILCFVILPAAWRIMFRRRYGPLSWIDAGCIAWLTATVAYVGYQARIADHYAILVVPALAILAAPVVSGTFAAMRTSPRALLFGSLPVMAVIWISGTLSVIVGSIDYVAPPSNAQVTGAAAWIRTHSSPTDTIFVWGNVPDLYDTAQRWPATRWIYLLPLLTPGYSTPAQTAELAATLEARRPVFIVDAGSDQPGGPAMVPALLIARPVLFGDGRTFDTLDPVRTYIRDHYVLAEIVNGWPIYALR